MSIYEASISPGGLERGLEAEQLVGADPPTAVVVELAQVREAPEVRRLWRKFQQVLSLPEKDRAVFRLANSLVDAKTAGGRR